MGAVTRPLSSQGGVDDNRWRAAFPYRWDADDLVSRRELLRFAVYASGALFGSTALIAILGALRRTPEQLVQPVARATDVPENSAVYFNYPDADSQAMLLHLPGGRFVAYSQRCTHLSCAVFFQPDQQRLYCPCHEGVFSPETGDPVAGPPQRRLAQIVLKQEGEVLFATDIHP
jgi:nitrite reductase/ring-hydroxylating ferredoxin subunit